MNYNKTLSAEEKFIELEKTYYNALQRIPVEHIAGYPGMGPPSLKNA